MQQSITKAFSLMIRFQSQSRELSTLWFQWKVILDLTIFKSKSAINNNKKII